MNAREALFRGAMPSPGTDVWNQPLETGAPPTTIPQTALVPPFWQIKPPGGQDLSSATRGVLAAGAGATIRLTPFPLFRTLPSFKGVLQSLVLTVIAPLATLDIVFTLLNNNAPVPGWRFVPQQVAANALILPFNGPLQINQNANLEVVATNNAASGPWNLEIALVGWQWSTVLEKRIFGYSSEDQ